MLNKYNSIAVLYTLLSKLVYGNSLHNIQKKAVNQLPKEGRLLILGGGDGSILRYLYQQRPQLDIEFLEASRKMIDLARLKSRPNQKITFIHSDNPENCSPEITLILAPFFFDLFTTDETAMMLNKIEAKVNKSFILLVTDFSLDSIKHWRLLRHLQIKLSIIFFRVTVGHRLNYLPSVFQNIEKCGYKPLFYSHLQGGFVCLQVFSSP